MARKFADGEKVILVARPELGAWEIWAKVRFFNYKPAKKTYEIVQHATPESPVVGYKTVHEKEIRRAKEE